MQSLGNFATAAHRYGNPFAKRLQMIIHRCVRLFGLLDC